MLIKNAFILRYDTEKYDFRRWAASVLEWNDLESLHQRHDLSTFAPIDTVPQIEVCRGALTAKFQNVSELYTHFVENFLGSELGGVTSYQIPPSFRIHYSHRGSSAFHRDRDFGVASGRLNAWVPLTSVWGENSIWVEKEENCEEFVPVKLDYGELLIFDAANLLHGSKWNSTESTRVSFDLRFALKSATGTGTLPSDDGTSIATR